MLSAAPPSSSPTVASRAIVLLFLLLLSDGSTLSCCNHTPSTVPPAETARFSQCFLYHFVCPKPILVYQVNVYTMVFIIYQWLKKGALFAPSISNQPLSLSSPLPQGATSEPTRRIIIGSQPPPLLRPNRSSTFGRRFPRSVKVGQVAKTGQLRIAPHRRGGCGSQASVLLSRFGSRLSRACLGKCSRFIRKWHPERCVVSPSTAWCRRARTQHATRRTRPGRIAPAHRPVQTLFLC